MDYSGTYSATPFHNLSSRLVAFCIIITLTHGLDRDPGPLIPQPKCEPIEIAMCQSLPYNVTKFPNLVANEEQTEAEVQLKTFRPLLEAHCSSQLQFFLCSVYVPMCTDKIPTSIGPCRPLCESVRSRCEPILSQFGFPWPTSLNCSKFPPENNAHAMCMRGPEEEDGPQVSIKTLSETTWKRPGDTDLRSQSPVVPCPTSTSMSKLIYINRTGACALECSARGPYSLPQKSNAEAVVFGGALVTLILAIITVFLHAMYKGRWVSLPENAVVLISVCYGLGSIGYVIRWIWGRDETACVSYAHTSVYVVAGLQQVACTVVAITIYYFFAAARMWWLVLCYMWFSIAGLGKNRKKMDVYKFWFHLGSWGIPVFQVFVVLVLQAAEADPLTGLCFVGEQDKTQLLYLVLIPEGLVVFAGFIFLLAGLGCFLIVEPELCPDKPVSQSHPDPPLPSLLSTGLIGGIYLPISATLSVCFIFLYNESYSLETVLVKHIAQLLYGVLASGWCLYSNLPALPCFCHSHLGKTVETRCVPHQHQLQPMLPSFPPPSHMSSSPFQTLLPSPPNTYTTWRQSNR